MMWLLEHISLTYEKSQMMEIKVNITGHILSQYFTIVFLFVMDSNLLDRPLLARLSPNPGACLGEHVWFT